MKEFETNRLILRSYKESDIDDYFEFASNKKICKMAGIDACEDLNKANKRLKEKIGQDNSFAVVSKENGKVIGDIQIDFHYPLLFSPNKFEFGARDISFMLSEKYWGNGYMIEALEPVIEYLFNEIQICQLVYSYLDKNTASKRVLEKLKFPEAKRANYVRGWIDGSDSLVMQSGMTREHYNDIKRRDYGKS